MAQAKFKTVDIQTKAGSQLYDKLKKEGWEAVSVGSRTVTLRKKKPVVTAHADTRLYSVPWFNHKGEHDGWTALGFDVCKRRADALAQEMGEPLPKGRVGSITLYNEYQSLLAKAHAKHKATGWRSQSELDPKLVGLEGQYVEVVNSVGEKERFWVGKSGGWVPVHLAILRRNSTGGAAVCGPVKSVKVLSPPRLSR